MLKGIADLLIARRALDNIAQGKKSLHRGNIELRSGVLFQNADGVVMPHAAAIWTVRRHGIVSIGDFHDARDARRLLALQPLRVTGAVPVFVMQLHYGKVW